MKLALILIIISTLAGILALWKDDIIGIKSKASDPDLFEETFFQKQEREKEKQKQAKAKKVKYVTTLLLVLTLLITIFKINDDNHKAKLATEEARYQHHIDSLEHYNDSIERLHIDTIRQSEIQQLQMQLLYGKIIDSIKIKSAFILHGLTEVDYAINTSIYKIDESSAKAKTSFNELAFAARRQSLMLDSNLTSTFRFGFRCKKTETEIADYIKTNGLKGEYIKIDDNFPFYTQLQELLNGFTIEFKFFSNKTNAKMKSDRTQKVMLDIYGNNPMMILVNKKNIGFGFRRVMDNSNLLPSSLTPTNAFNMTYHIPSKSFYFMCDNVELRIDERRDQYFSILDYDESALLITLVTPEVRDNPNCFFNLDDSYINFSIEFSKAHTEWKSYIEPLNFDGKDLFPNYFVDTVNLKYD